MHCIRHLTILLQPVSLMEAKYQVLPSLICILDGGEAHLAGTLRTLMHAVPSTSTWEKRSLGMGK